MITTMTTTVNETIVDTPLLQLAGTSGLQLTGKAHGRWRRRRNERSGSILEAMTLLRRRYGPIVTAAVYK